MSNGNIVRVLHSQISKCWGIYSTCYFYLIIWNRSTIKTNKTLHAPLVASVVVTGGYLQKSNSLLLNTLEALGAAGLIGLKIRPPGRVRELVNSFKASSNILKCSFSLIQEVIACETFPVCIPIILWSVLLWRKKLNHLMIKKFQLLWNIL